MALAEIERLLRAARTGPRPSATEEGQEGIAASREERPARWTPA